MIQSDLNRLTKLAEVFGAACIKELGLELGFIACVGVKDKKSVAVHIISSDCPSNLIEDIIEFCSVVIKDLKVKLK